mmetsp:Transcript_28244/g.77548  ORF Transcript_28244/g.77548 Transcript_28244/m.77548 type:complete len:288 (+) Transcript_28244:381-1244(+)|eukprot:CAMPEP_0168748112 /NCGR_PEP_ID=MMETSP0724-20121128/16007_1 /TAXON_ID=265536 /ORGANISM="Amphiprora sp., Strain CCMP467" /LENGTH=287 /DNA_ID=CAMNT_0008795929 /DNA_START=314 /DNA_END=1174 /DNA_ORIENTATION=-
MTSLAKIGRRKGILKRHSSYRGKGDNDDPSWFQECLEPTETSTSTFGDSFVEQQQAHPSQLGEKHMRSRSTGGQRQRRGSLTNLVSAVFNPPECHDRYFAVMFQQKCDELVRKVEQVIQELKQDVREIQRKISNQLSTERSSASTFLATRRQVRKLEGERKRVMRGLDYLQALRIHVVMERDDAQETKKNLSFSSLPSFDTMTDTVRRILSSDDDDNNDDDHTSGRPSPTTSPPCQRPGELLEKTPSTEALLSAVEAKDGWCLDKKTASYPSTRGVNRRRSCTATMA